MLPRPDRLRLLAASEPVELVLADVLCEPGESMRHAYFPSGGFVSLLAPANGSGCIEVGMVGREGMLGTHLALGVVAAPLRALVQGAGIAHRVEAAVFLRELARSAALRAGLNRYLYVLMAQLATSATCLRFHQIGPRLARWLLMSQDRAGADCFRVTQASLAFMLGVRRPGISQAAGALQRAGLIRYQRGELAVLDRGGLEAAACSCYVIDRRVHAAVLG